MSDRIAAMNLALRRQKEIQRQARIFNDEVRTIGIDKHALEMQRQAKKKREEMEKETPNVHAAYMLQSSKSASLTESRQFKERGAVEEATTQYWHRHQQPWSRQEFDLNNGERCRNTDGQGAQMMLPGLPGEDPGRDARLKTQKEQLRQWLLQHRAEQAEAKRQQMLDEQCYDQSRTDVDSKALQLEVGDLERRKAEAVATKKYNLAMAEDNAERHHSHHNLGDHQADMIYHSQEQATWEEGRPISGMLGAPCLWPNTDKRDPPESQQQVTQFQIYQTEERKRIELENQLEEERRERLLVDSARTAVLLEREQIRLKRQQRRDVDNDNVRMAELQKQQKKELGRGSIDDSFFSKFSACSR